MQYETTGMTPEGKPLVYREMFKLFLKEKIPIDLLAIQTIKEGMEPDWFAEIEGALQIGISEESIINVFRRVFKVVYPEIWLLKISETKAYMRLRYKPYKRPIKTIKSEFL